MKKVLLIIGAVICVLAITFFIQIDIKVERSANVKASLNDIKTQVTDFKEFVTWSPWTDLDPNSIQEFSDIQEQVGAVYKWSGNDQVGVGSQTITSISDERVEMDLVFTAPWQSTSKVYYTFTKEGEGYNVVWGYEGEFSLLMNLFMSMDDMLGGQYEKGLASLKEKIEK